MSETDVNDIFLTSIQLGSPVPLQLAASSCYSCGVYLSFFPLQSLSLEDSSEASPKRMRFLEENSMPASHCRNCGALLCASCCSMLVSPINPYLTGAPNGSAATRSAPSGLSKGSNMVYSTPREKVANVICNVRSSAQTSPWGALQILGNYIGQSINNLTSERKCKSISVCQSCFVNDLAYMVLSVTSPEIRCVRLFDSEDDAEQYYCLKIHVNASIIMIHVGSGITIKSSFKSPSIEYEMRQIVKHEREKMINVNFRYPFTVPSGFVRNRLQYLTGTTPEAPLALSIGDIYDICIDNGKDSSEAKSHVGNTLVHPLIYLDIDISVLNTYNNSAKEALQEALKQIEKKRVESFDDAIAESYDLLPISNNETDSPELPYDPMHFLPLEEDDVPIYSTSMPPREAYCQFSDESCQSTIGSQNSTGMRNTRQRTASHNPFHPAFLQQRNSDKPSKKESQANNCDEDPLIRNISSRSLIKRSDYAGSQAETILSNLLKGPVITAICVCPFYYCNAVVWRSTDGCFEHRWIPGCLQTLKQRYPHSGEGNKIYDDPYTTCDAIHFLRSNIPNLSYGTCINMNGVVIFTINRLQQIETPLGAAAAISQSEESFIEKECLYYLRKHIPVARAVAPRAPIADINEVVTTQYRDAFAAFVELYSKREDINTTEVIIDGTGQVVACRNTHALPDCLTSQCDKQWEMEPIPSDTVLAELSASRKVIDYPQLILSSAPSHIQLLARKGSREIMRANHIASLFVVVPLRNEKRISVINNIHGNKIHQMFMSSYSPIEEDEVCFIFPSASLYDANNMIEDYETGIVVSIGDGSTPRLSIFRRYYTVPKEVVLAMYAEACDSPLISAYKHDGNAPLAARKNKTKRNGFALECEVCFDGFNTQSRRPILCAHCGNTICLKCYEKINTCCFCRKVTQGPPLTNVALLQILL